MISENAISAIKNIIGDRQADNIDHVQNLLFFKKTISGYKGSDALKENIWKSPRIFFEMIKIFKLLIFQDFIFFQKPLIFKFVAGKHAGFLDSCRCGSGFQM